MNNNEPDGRFFTESQIVVFISDALAPLIKMAILFKSNITSDFEIRNQRQAALDMTDLTTRSACTNIY